ncbi:phosphotransferase family protein [Nocardioides caldifontis]|uniref:phosphotransferase family protein n=1 Tax=Nocardioides caldifontis TaxID=2588938 RepID=UPI001396B1F2|nr:phosphotransferase family protein [Nocardioides caldifontis]
MSAADDAITPELRDRVSRLAGDEVTELRPMPGGHSGITLTASTASGGRLVVKVAAAGRPAVGRHDVLRQARAMALVAAHVPVPQVIATEEAEPPLALVSFAAGEAVEPVIDETGADLPADLVRRRFDVATELLATLHRVPVDGLGDEPVRTPSDELAQFRRIAAAGEEEFRPLGEEAGKRLAEAVPGAGAVALVHGDFRLGNLLMEGTVPRALVDWEIWTLGDPRVDLGWLATFADASHFPGIARDDVTVPGVDHVVAAYGEAAGGPVEDAEWFLRLGAFRMGAIMAHNLHRHRTGRHVDPYQEKLPPTIERLLQVAAGKG